MGLGILLGWHSRLLLKSIRNEVLLFDMRESVFTGKGFLLTFSMTFKQTEWSVVV